MKLSNSGPGIRDEMKSCLVIEGKRVRKGLEYLCLKLYLPPDSAGFDANGELRDNAVYG